MKKIKYLFATLALTAAITSCSNEDENPLVLEENPLADYTMLTSLTANGHDIEVYSDQDGFTMGYNELFIRIKDGTTDSYIKDAEITLMPVMQMAEMMHSCPKSEIYKTENASVYKGFVIFQMPGNADEYWELNLEYTINGETFKAAERIEVKAPADDKRTVTSFMGSDDIRYIVAMTAFDPGVKVNDFSAMVFKMENMMSFPAVENYKIAIDPRMPGMGNHSSPNNVDLIYDATSKMYNGKLSLTMTGYWKINLQLMNEADQVVKGETVTDENESSSLFFEIEF
ncbi:hypothetical protein SAMN05421636_105225 [Pricia antarctica]|uniref:YtkA-like n=1 Tax=Pricia antarctica TaxID=641691 RepID=A0A1G7D9H7_9FLAO|nr:hypothetical protein [Pricia antarctica]SDE48149.1 hypothetical protein SAMN05421636_105225 [Pricia antarctica]